MLLLFNFHVRYILMAKRKQVISRRRHPKYFPPKDDTHVGSIVCTQQMDNLT